MTERQSAQPDLLAELATLGSLALAAGRARTSREVASAALDILARSTGADAGTVLFDGGNSLIVEASFGFPPGAIEAIVTDRSSSDRLVEALESLSSFLFVPTRDAPIRPEIADRLFAEGLIHLLAAPLRASGRLVGILGLAWRVEPAVPPADVTVIHASALVAAGLQNAHLVAQLQRTLASERRLADEEAALQSLTLVAESAGAFEELAATTVGQIVSLLGAAGGSYALLTEDDRVEHKASVGIDREFILEDLDIPASTMVSVRRMLEGSGPYVQDYVEGSVQPRTLEMARARHWTAFAMLPITVRDRVEALIAVFFGSPPDLPDAERTLTAIARIASISLANFRLREGLIASETRYLMIVRDLTEPHRLQQELLQAQKMEAIGQLVSGVAHELNNPLAAIVAFGQLIRRDDRLPDDMQRDAELLVQEADRTRRIVQNLLDFARQRPPERHPTQIATLVESVLALQSYGLAAARIRLSIDLPADLPLIDVDRSQLQQVLLNLTLNAIQAIRAAHSEGEIVITARRVASRVEGPRVQLSVSDDGPGIPDGAESRLFLPFYTTKAPGEGTGLGLSVSFGIVAAHGGSLRFEPRPGGGATFIVELPVSSRIPRERRRPVAPGGPRSQIPAATPEAALSDGETRAAAPPRVLVLDDEPSIRAFLTKSLRLARLDPVVVAHGLDAIERCRTEAFAAVLVDHRMPGMSGTEVFAAVVAIRPELGPRFVLMSGDVLNPELREFASTHHVALLAKPFDVDTVNRLVGDIVTGRFDLS